ncbi:MAG: hypothetical protein ACRCYY_09065 [Trueperaceae bacterium]
MPKFRMLLFLVFVLSLSGCEQVALEATKRFNITLEPDTLTIVRGSTGTTTVTLTPITGFDLGSEAATVTLISPPTGVSATPLSLPAGITNRPLTLAIDAAAVPVTDQEVIIEVQKDGRGVDAILKLTIQ